MDTMRRLRRTLGSFAVFFLGLGISTGTGLAAPGDVINTQDSDFNPIPYEQSYFAFEVEGVLSSLKDEPTWNEVEKMLDNPYAIAIAPDVRGNYQGWPSYRSTHPRRRSFIYRNSSGNPCAPGTSGCSEVPLSGFVIHPLNYNYQGGEELRLVNPKFAGAPWIVPDHFELTQPGTPDHYEWSYVRIDVTPGSERMEADGAAIDFNSPLKPQIQFHFDGSGNLVIDNNGATIITAETSPPEGSEVQGGDPGEPGYAGFGVLLGNNRTQYSTPAVPGATTQDGGNGTNPADNLVKNSIILPNGTVRRLYDPGRGYIAPRGSNGKGGLRKPSLRISEAGGTPSNPNYLVNDEASLSDDPAALLPSNENDYVKNRSYAAVLGKALFWDMQVGSDSVQACGTCHFNAGADSRTKNQLNPNHLGLDFDFEVFANRSDGSAAQDPNQDLRASDFPFHKRVDRTVPGDGRLTPSLASRDANDVASSMGVSRFKLFQDVPVGTAAFSGSTLGVKSLLPDIGSVETDPILVMDGFRRVEPRNTPTMIGAAFNFDNFWDGRARHDFNGANPFGPSDPAAHVFVSQGGGLTATRQLIRFSSMASLAEGPPLSDFEMSFSGRNWAKLGKRLLQSGVVPLANQRVNPKDSVLGPWSNQGGSSCPSSAVAAGKPGLCISYNELIRRTYYNALWSSEQAHLEGAPCDDPFDRFCLEIAPNAAAALNTNQFTQMQANFSLFFGLAVQTWIQMLIADDSPMDRFYDRNPDAFATFGESGEPGLVLDFLNCGQPNPTNNSEPETQPCFTEVGNFKRDPGVIAYLNRTGEASVGDPVESGGSRQPNDPDPLLGMDFFLGSNFSLRNPEYRSLRCGECHQGGTLTDHTFAVSNQLAFNDWAAEFEPGKPGVALFPEPLGRSRMISGFALEAEINGNAQDAVERNIADFCAVEPCTDANGAPVPTTQAQGGPQGQALFDNGIYNIGLRPIAEDQGRGGKDPFGFPLSLARLALKNLGGPDYTSGGDDPNDGFAQPPSPGFPLPNFDPANEYPSGGLFEPTVQDQGLNPGFEEEPVDPKLPPYLAPWASNINVGDEVEIDELFFGLNTLSPNPILEGFIDNFGNFNPSATVGETFNNAIQPSSMASWPNVNRVNAEGSFKAPSLRNAALTPPYFHTGSYLTLRQVVDFYMRGGDFPVSNKAHRDFLIANMLNEDEALGGLDPAFKEKVLNGVVDFLIEMIDERVALQRAPFDQPEIFVPLDGKSPENTFGRAGLASRPTEFLRVADTGQGGLPTPPIPFLGVTRIRPGQSGFNCNPTNGPISHYCP